MHNCLWFSENKTLSEVSTVKKPKKPLPTHGRENCFCLSVSAD